MSSMHVFKNLTKFADNEEWAGCFDDVMELHLGVVATQLGIQPVEFFQELDAYLQSMIWGCVFEDFLTLDFDVPGENVVDEYLKRRSWREKAPAKAYMKALRNSVISLYEVTDVSPGKSMELKDIYRDREPVTVFEKSGTQNLKQGDKVAVRVVEVFGKPMITGGSLVFNELAAQMLNKSVAESLEITETEDLGNVSDDHLQRLGPVFTATWLIEALGEALSEAMPDLANSDDEDIIFHDLSFPFASNAAREKIAKLLDEAPDLTKFDANNWDWVEEDQRKPETKTEVGPGDDEFDDLDDEFDMKGSIELWEDKLVLSVDSAQEAEQGETMIKSLLGDLVMPPQTKTSSLNQMMDFFDVEKDVGGDQPQQLELELKQSTLDQVYRLLLEQRIPELDDAIPREAVKTKEGRKKVAAWLTDIETKSTQLGADELLADYDFSWIWRELGIERP